MDKREFEYHLPPECIAQHPPSRRRDARLLHAPRDGSPPRDYVFADIVDLLAPDDLLVVNDTRVLPARLYGEKATGGRVELMLERVIGRRRMTARMGASKPPRVDTRITIDGFTLRVIARDNEHYTLALDGDATIDDVLAAAGHTPLPPYIQRADTRADRDRYQTVWAREAGAVAAPTASLHFDTELLDVLSKRGIEMAHVTLHVGSGTYQRLREGPVEHQRLHEERIEVSETSAAAINAARRVGRRVVAVGTTVVRCLEAAARESNTGLVTAYRGETRLFLKPGNRFNIVDALITNFHEPQSSLLMLVCAFAGRETTLNAYDTARARGYRFLSYGDAMLID